MTTIRSGKAGWVGSGKPNTPHQDPPRLRIADGVAETFLRMPVPGERGENVTVADLSLTVADSDAAGAVTFTLRRVSERVPWSNLTDNTKPGVTGTSVTVTTAGAPVAGDVITFDMATLAQSALDDRHYGWRLTSDSASVTKFYGFETESGPVLDLTVTAEPAAATDLVPNGVGSLSNPFLTWTAPDLNGGDNQTAFQVQIATTDAPAEDADGTWTAPAYDSGTVTDPAPELDLSATAYAGVLDGGEFYWQVRWQSESGLWSPWSDTAHYVREAKPTWTWVNPTLGEVDSTQPTFSATLSGVGTLKAYRFTLALASRPNRVIASSRKQRTTSQTVSWQPQEMVYFVGDRDLLTLDDGETYIVTLEGWRPQSGGYVASVGDPVQVIDSETFTVNNASAIEAPVLTTVTEDDDLPVARLTFTRSTQPDSFVIYRNGKAVATVDAAEAHVSGTTYSATDVLANPMREHDYRVRAQVDGSGLSALSNEIAATVVPEGVWFVSRDLTLSACFGGPPPSMERTDTAGVFVIQGRDGENEQVVIRSGRGKVNGGFALQMAPGPGERSSADQLADLDAMADADEWVHVIAANTSRRVRLLDVSQVPNENIREGLEWVDVSGRIIEVG